MADWAKVELSSIMEPTRGISYGIVQPGARTPDGVPILRVADIKAGRISTANSIKVSKEVEAQHARTRLRGGELLITIVGTVGEMAIVEVPEAPVLH